MVKPLTEKQIKTEKPICGQKRTKLFDGNQLFVYITPAGTKTYYQEYKFDGKPEAIKLGRVEEISLIEARRLRDKNRLDIAKGINPKEKAEKQKLKKLKKAQKTKKRFIELFEEFCDYQNTAKGVHKPVWAAKTRKDHENRFKNHVLPFIGNKKIKQVKTEDLTDLLFEVERKGVLENLKRIRSVFGQMFDYAVAKKYLKKNIANDIPDKVFKKRKSKPFKHVTIPYELKSVYSKIIGMERVKYVTKFAIRLQVLLFLRPGSTVSLKWSYVDFEKGLVTIPLDKMKSDRVHLIPMSDKVREILLELYAYSGHGEFIFPSPNKSGQSIVGCTLSKALRTHNIREIQPHGLRHTASTMLNEMGFDKDAIEIQLSHLIPGVRGTYNKAIKLKERIHMMQSWSVFLDTILDMDDVELKDFSSEKLSNF